MDIYSTSGDRRRQTRSRVFRCLYDSAEPLSKQELAARLSLSLPTVYQNINELLEMGLIEYTGPQASRGGRPAMQMRVVGAARYAVGIFITEEKVHFALTDLMCQALDYRDMLYEHGLFTDSFNRQLADELELFLDINKVDREKLLGVGVCLSGIIDQDSGNIFYAPTLGLRNVSLQPLLDAIPYPTHAENDANCGGFAEWFIHGGDNCIAFLSLTGGVGGALFVNGDKYLGTNRRSGEFGHMCVEKGGLPCSCGKRGCLEAYCSSSRLSTELGISLEEFFRLLDEGDERVQPIWSDYLEHLAVGIHNARMVLDCKVVLGGTMTEHIAPHMPRLRSLVAKLDPFFSEGDAEYLSLGHFSGKGPLLGAAFYFVRDFLENNI